MPGAPGTPDQGAPIRASGKPGNHAVTPGFTFRRDPSLSGVLRHLGAKLVLLRRDLRPEVLRRPDRPDLEVARPRHRVGAAPGPLHRFLHRADLPDPEARHQLLRLGEGAVGHRPLCSVEVNPLPEPARLEPVTGEHDPRLDQLLIVLAHLLEHLLRPLHLEGTRLGLRLLRGLHDHHDPHVTSFMVGNGSDGLLYRYVDWANRNSTSAHSGRQNLAESPARMPHTWQMAGFEHARANARMENASRWGTATCNVQASPASAPRQCPRRPLRSDF